MFKWISVVACVLILIALGFYSEVQASPLPGLTVTPTATQTATATPTAFTSPISTPTPTPLPPTEIQDIDPVITKRGGPSEALPGEQVTFTIQVTNRGRYAVVDVVVTDDIPEYLDILEVTTTQGTIRIERQRVIISVGVVGSGFVVDIVITTRVRDDVPTPCELENIANLTSSNGGERVSGPVRVRIPHTILPVTGGDGSYHTPSLWMTVKTAAQKTLAHPDSLKLFAGGTVLLLALIWAIRQIKP